MEIMSLTWNWKKWSKSRSKKRYPSENIAEYEK